MTKMHNRSIPRSTNIFLQISADINRRDSCCLRCCCYVSMTFAAEFFAISLSSAQSHCKLQQYCTSMQNWLRSIRSTGVPVIGNMRRYGYLDEKDCIDRARMEYSHSGSTWIFCENALLYTLSVMFVSYLSIIIFVIFEMKKCWVLL